MVFVRIDPNSFVPLVYKEVINLADYATDFNKFITVLIKAIGGDLDAEVDRILDKIHQTGEASLTAQEQETLKEASRRYKKQ